MPLLWLVALRLEELVLLVQLEERRQVRNAVSLLQLQVRRQGCQQQGTIPACRPTEKPERRRETNKQARRPPGGPGRGARGRA